MILAIGFIAIAFFLVSYYFQVKSLLLNKNIKGVSMIFWGLIALATSITFHNLNSSNAMWYVQVPQFINAIIALVLLLWVSFKKLRLYGLWISVMAYIGLVSIFIIQVDVEFIQHGASVFILFAYIEQILHMFRVRTSQGVNPYLFIGFGTGLLIMVINIIVTGAPISAAITEMCNIVAIIIATIVTYYYEKK